MPYRKRLQKWYISQAQLIIHWNYFLGPIYRSTQDFCNAKKDTKNYVQFKRDNHVGIYLSQIILWHFTRITFTQFYSYQTIEIFSILIHGSINMILDLKITFTYLGLILLSLKKVPIFHVSSYLIIYQRKWNLVPKKRAHKNSPHFFWHISFIRYLST
jgi:hypothetical protein